jgi:hypothetical protein
MMTGLRGALDRGFARQARHRFYRKVRRAHGPCKLRACESLFDGWNSRKRAPFDVIGANIGSMAPISVRAFAALPLSRVALLLL